MISHRFKAIFSVLFYFLILQVQSASVPIDRSGWTATADSFQTGYEPSNAIDGNDASLWHSEYTPNVDPLPHWIVLDMKAQFNIHAISIQPRPDESGPNGRIGGHKIEVSTDNTNWRLAALGTYNNDAITKKTFFVTRQARYVRITATTEAQSPGNQFTSIAEVNVFHDVEGTTPTPYTPPVRGKGLWEKTVDFPMVPASVSLLTNGKVLLWSSSAKETIGGNEGLTYTAIFDPATGESSELAITNTQHDMFCPGISLDFNGRVVVTGGSNAARTSIYDANSNAWVSAANMQIPRGYQSTATCSDGRIFNIGGSWRGGLGGKNGEIYDPTANTWSLLPGALVSPMETNDKGGVYRSDNHGWLFGWKNGTVFQAGPSKAMNWYDTKGTGATSGAGNRLDDTDAMGGNAIMYDAPAGKILTAGGSPQYGGEESTSNAYVITIGEPKSTPRVEKTQSMAYQRGYAGGVVLPDGTVFVTGGQTLLLGFSDRNATFTPELWSPRTGQWTQMNPMAIPRGYHSVAILLPDATVFNGGGGLCGQGCTDGFQNNHFDAEIFVPPYLLNSDGTRRRRPTIERVASTVKLGARLSITTDTLLSTFSLVRFGTATHTVNTDQRRIPLTPSLGIGTSYTVTIPSDPGVALPGYWLLFAIDLAGTPSVAKVIKLER